MPRNLGDGVPQRDLVVEPDRRDDREGRVDDVGEIVPPARADLDHGDIDPPPGEVGADERDPDLAVRQRQPGAPAPGGPDLQDVVDEVGELPRSDQAAVDLQLLGGGLQVGRDVQAGAQARPAQDLGEEDAGRAFARGPADVHHRVGAMGVAEVGEERAHVGEALLGARANLGLRLPDRRLAALDQGVGATHGIVEA